MFHNKKTGPPDESREIYEITVAKAGSERGPAVSVYWNQHLTEQCELNYYIAVLRNENRTVLINTGLPDDISPFENFVQEWHPDCHILRSENETTPAALNRLAVDPAAVETVILTPLTIYTTGQLALFPKARFAVGRRGWTDFWSPKPNAPRLPTDIAIARTSRIYLACEALERVLLLEDDDTVCPGVDVFYTGGHHTSSLAVRVATNRGNVILGDCFFTYDNLEKNIPIGWHENLREIYAAYDRVRKEADIAVPLYDPEVLNRYPDGRIA
jgi:glyoxylase-like metal-dependent hydrolase (beta-lactamase superfamily II)